MIVKSDLLNISAKTSMSNSKPTTEIRTKITDSSKQSNNSAKDAVTFLNDAFYESAPYNANIRDGSFNNSALKLGLSDKALNSAEFLADLITFQRGSITNIYHGSWIFRRIIDKVAQDMWSSGITINGDTDPEDLKRVYKKLARLKTDNIWTTEQARLYGGAATLVMVDDGADDLRQPLNLKKIKRGTPIQLYSTDRWYGLSTSSEKVTNYKSRDFNTPKYYEFFIEDNIAENNQSNITVHHSRVLRFVNRRSVRLINTKLNGWGISELEHIMQDLMIHENAKNSTGSLIEKALLEIIHVDGLRGMMQGLSTGSSAQQSVLAGELAGLQNFRTNNFALLDTDTKYEQLTYSFSGLSEILETQKEIIAGAAEMPQVLLYGDTKGGLTSDSPAEMLFYAGTILGKQEDMLRPVLDKLLPIIYATEGIPVPDDLDYDFNSIVNDTQDKKSALVSSTLQAVSTAIDLGLMTHKTALNELKQIQKQTGFGTNINEEDEELAKNSDIPEDENSLGEMGGGFPIDGMESTEGDDFDLDSEPDVDPDKTPKGAPMVDDYADEVDKILGRKKLFDKHRRKRVKDVKVDGLYSSLYKNGFTKEDLEGKYIDELVNLLGNETKPEIANNAPKYDDINKKDIRFSINKGDNYYDRILRQVNTANKPIKVKHLNGSEAIADLKMMTPDDYLQRCAKQKNISINDYMNLLKSEDERNDKLLKLLKDTNNIRVGYLDSVNNTQDGAHRALLAKKLGLNKIPVLEINKL